jgi:hypothetical protein
MQLGILGEDRAFRKRILEVIGATEYEISDSQRDGIYGDFVPTVSKWWTSAFVYDGCK